MAMAVDMVVGMAMPMPMAMVDETLENLWLCPGTQVRARFLAAIDGSSADHPKCLSMCGTLPKSLGIGTDFVKGAQSMLSAVLRARNTNREGGSAEEVDELSLTTEEFDWQQTTLCMILCMMRYLIRCVVLYIILCIFLRTRLRTISCTR